MRWYYWPLWVWAAPLTAFGLLWTKFIYKAHTYRYHDGVFSCLSPNIWGSGIIAQTLGACIVYKNETWRSNVPVRVHEHVHVKQCLYGGILLPLAYFSASLWIYWRRKDLWAAYRANPFEVAAYDYDRAFRQGKLTEVPWGA